MDRGCHLGVKLQEEQGDCGSTELENKKIKELMFSKNF